jgi:hypothetical protein
VWIYIHMLTRHPGNPFDARYAAGQRPGNSGAAQDGLTVLSCEPMQHETLASLRAKLKAHRSVEARTFWGVRLPVGGPDRCLASRNEPQFADRPAQD